MLTLRKTLSKYKDVVLLSFIAIIIGVLVGAIDTLFGKVLLEISNIRSAYIFQLVPFLPLAGMLIIFTYSKIGKNSIKGMSLIFSVGLEEEDNIPRR